MGLVVTELDCLDFSSVYEQKRTCVDLKGPTALRLLHAEKEGACSSVGEPKGAEEARESQQRREHGVRNLRVSDVVVSKALRRVHMSGTDEFQTHNWGGGEGALIEG